MTETKSSSTSSTNHRITDWLRLAGTSGGHLVQHSSSSRGTESQLPRTMYRKPWNIAKVGDSTTSLGNLLQVNLTVEALWWFAAKLFDLQGKNKHYNATLDTEALYLSLLFMKWHKNGAHFSRMVFLMRWKLSSLQNETATDHATKPVCSLRKDEGNCKLHLNVRNMLYVYNEKHDYHRINQRIN